MTDSLEFGEGAQGINLAPELSRYVSERTLQKNAEQYPELQRMLSQEQGRKASIIKSRLLDLPLIHATAEPLPSSSNILSAIDLPEGGKNTYELDKSLGLHRYTFFHWGLPEKSSYGRNFVLVQPDILLHPGTVVTPYDIGEIAYVDNTRYEDLPTEKQKRYKEGYLDKMVTGKIWLEIIARRILTSYESGKSFFPLYGRGTLGEIKHLGAVNAQKVIRQIDDKTLQPYFKFLYDQGFSNNHMEDVRTLLQRTGKRHGVDPLPEECGIDYEEASGYWKKQLE